MTISATIGKATGKVLHATASAPKATARKFKNIGHDMASGYREVIPAKPKTEKTEDETPAAPAEAEVIVPDAVL
jgi:hypothetical protein